MAVTNETPTATTLTCTGVDAMRIRNIADERGTFVNRAVSLLVIGWDMLTREQQDEAARRLAASRRREAQPA